MVINTVQGEMYISFKCDVYFTIHCLNIKFMIKLNIMVNINFFLTISKNTSIVGY